MAAKTQQTRRRPAASSTKRSRRAWPAARIALGALVVAAIGGGAIVAILRSRGQPASAAITHVHGLGINPADGSLHVATHTGTFRITGDGPIQRAGTTAQDTMGFTVVGPNHFLGSGHPEPSGLRLGKPSRLGLIESTDGGATWASRSLDGKVDFHALATSQGTTYGWDSGSNRLLASTDNANWETRSTLQLFGLAVDPARPDRLVAAGPTGTTRSTDGGRTWQPISGAPRLTAVSWAAGGTLWGADGNGGAHRSTDAGSTWEAAGGVNGQPEALLATDDRLVIAVATPDGRTAIHQSLNGGGTWQLLYENPG
jgi:hypothetical protein